MRNPIRINYTALSGGLFFTLLIVLMIPALGQMRNVFSVDGFDPHAHCFAWNQPILRMYLVSDSLIGVSYLGIASMLLYLYQRFRDILPAPWILLAFSAFIFSCGITHFMDVWTLWNPTYRLSAYAKFITAVVSAGTALVLPPLIPRLLGIVNEAKVSDRRREDLVTINQQLQAEIAQHRQTLSALQQSEKRLRTVIDNAPVVLSTISADGIISMVEGNALRQINFPFKDMVGEDVKAVNGLDPSITDAVEVALSGQDTVVVAQRDKVTFENRFSPVIETDGSVTGVIGVSVDISQRIQAEQNLRKAYEKERELNALRERFIARMSHEFRTPLSIINSAVEMLHHYFERMTQDQRQEKATRVHTEILNLTRMLDDVLLIGQMEADYIEFKPETFDLASLYRRAVDDLSYAQDKVNLHFTSNIESLTVTMDQQLMTYIINNLVTNAVKYSHAGDDVHLSLTQTDTMVRFTVEDHGIGIPEENYGRIFDRFYRGNNIEGIAGTGLGLSIVKRAVDLHGGTVTFESVLDRGTTFTVNLPLDQATT